MFADCSVEIRPEGARMEADRPTGRLLNIPARGEDGLDQRSHSGSSRKKRWDSRYELKVKLTRCLMAHVRKENKGPLRCLWLEELENLVAIN